MKSDFLLAITQLCSERNLPKEVVIEAIQAALISAYKRNFGAARNVSVKLDLSSGKAKVYAEKEVMEEVQDERSQISLAEARKIDENAEVGGTVTIEATPRRFGRIAAQTAKQVILQRIREAERDALYEAYADREGEIVSGTIKSMHAQVINLNLGRAEAILPRSEQIPTERYHLNQRIRVYVLEVRKTNRGPRIIVSRAHRNMLRRLLELEVPEIFNGAVEIKAIAREAGFRSKVAVTAIQEEIDPVGSCVGVRGVRIQSVVNELNGEKIDVVEWSPDTATFIANALSPAKVIEVELQKDKGGKTATVVVPDDRLSLAIGRAGQNARLAAKLTGWRIDIKSASEMEELRREEEARLAEAALEEKIEEVAAIATDVYDMPLKELGLSTRVHNCLERAGIEKMGQALEKSEEELLAIKGFGVKSLAELQEGLKAFATTEAEKIEPAPVVEEMEPAVPEETEEVEEVAAEETEGVEEAEAEEIEEYPEYEEELEEEWDWEEDKLEHKAKKSRQRKRTLIYDEELGEVVVRRKRKPSRRRDKWETELEQWEMEHGGD